MSAKFKSCVNVVRISMIQDTPITMNNFIFMVNLRECIQCYWACLARISSVENTKNDFFFKKWIYTNMALFARKLLRRVCTSFSVALCMRWISAFMRLQWIDVKRNKTEFRNICRPHGNRKNRRCPRQCCADIEHNWKESNELRNYGILWNFIRVLATLTWKPALIAIDRHRWAPFVRHPFISIDQNGDCRPYERCSPCINRVINESAVVFIAPHHKRRTQRAETTFEIITIVLSTPKTFSRKGIFIGYECNPRYANKRQIFTQRFARKSSTMPIFVVPSKNR